MSGDEGAGRENGLEEAAAAPGGQLDDVTRDLLAKLEEANRQLAADDRAVSSPVTSRLRHHSAANGNSDTTSIHSANSGSSPSRSHSREPSEHGQGALAPSASTGGFFSGMGFFERTFGQSPSQEDDPQGNTPEELWTLWGKIVNDWDTYKKKGPYLKGIIRKGIPHHFRGLAWQYLTGAQETNAKALYQEYIKKSSPSEKLIRRDIARTYPAHDLFKENGGFGQESLFNVMKAYSLHDREVGYCQGSAFIAGLLLMQQMPEEEAFSVMVKLMQDYKLRELFKPTMAELGLCMFQLECLIQEHLPELFKHLQSQEVDASMFASSWFLTLFTTTLTLPVASRVMDIFISEGMEFIFKVALAILQCCQDDLLYVDMEGVLKHLTKEAPKKFEEDPEHLFSTAFPIKLNAKRMKRLEKEYTTKRNREQEEQIEIRRLRTENKLLRQRVDNIERETATLADRLVTDQVMRAEESEEIFSLKRQLEAAEQRAREAEKRLTDTVEEKHQVERKLGVKENLLQKIKEDSEQAFDGSPALVECGPEELLSRLQRELSHVRLKEAEAHSTIKELQDRIRELENIQRELQEGPKIQLASLQEELIAVRMREAEAQLAVKELRLRVTDLDAAWQRHLSKERSDSPAGGSRSSSKKQVAALQEELMTIRLREAESLGELKELKQRVMELESQTQITGNQMRRMDEEARRLRAQLEEASERERDLARIIRDKERKIADHETKLQEATLMWRLREAEHCTTSAELKQRVADLECRNQELLTAGQLHNTSVEADDSVEELADQIAGLKDEVLSLRLEGRGSDLPSALTPRDHAAHRPGGASDDEEGEEKDEESVRMSVQESEDMRSRLMRLAEADSRSSSSREGSVGRPATGSEAVGDSESLEKSVASGENCELVDKSVASGDNSESPEKSVASGDNSESPEKNVGDNSESTEKRVATGDNSELAEKSVRDTSELSEKSVASGDNSELTEKSVTSGDNSESAQKSDSNGCNSTGENKSNNNGGDSGNGSDTPVDSNLGDNPVKTTDSAVARGDSQDIAGEPESNAL